MAKKQLDPHTLRWCARRLRTLAKSSEALRADFEEGERFTAMSEANGETAAYRHAASEFSERARALTKKPSKRSKRRD